MTTITASLVKELREKTGVGMMACKEALTKADGNFEEAEKYLREKGLASASKKASRDATEGRVFVAQSADNKTAVILELSCETDFVSGNDDFAALGQQAADLALSSGAADVESLQAVDVDGRPFQNVVSDFVLKLGENINVKRFERAEAASTASYIHMNGKIGVLVTFGDAVDAELGRDVAMHIAAVNPEFITSDQVPADKVESEKDIFRTQLLNEGKPEQIIDKILEGKIRKYFEEICLVSQPFVKNPDQKVSDVLGSHTVASFTRYQLG